MTGGILPGKIDKRICVDDIEPVRAKEVLRSYDPLRIRAEGKPLEWLQPQVKGDIRASEIVAENILLVELPAAGAARIRPVTRMRPVKQMAS